VHLWSFAQPALESEVPPSTTPADATEMVCENDRSISRHAGQPGPAWRFPNLSATVN